MNPIYPPEAKTKGIQGTVKLHVLILTDGSVKILEVAPGDPMLVPAAEKAVLQWRYKPLLFNGQPVEVDTTVTVNFNLWH